MRAPSRFCLHWLIATALVLLIVGGFDAVIDPYCTVGTPRITGFNARKPYAAPHQLMAKTYEVERIRPVTVLLGSSRVDIGMNPRNRLWPATMRPVFNFGVDGAGLQEIFANLREAAATGRLSTAIVMLEFESFLYPTPAAASTGEAADRYLLTTGGRPNPARGLQRLRDLFLSTLTIGALEDSVATVFAQRTDLNANLTRHGLTTEGDFQRQADDNGYYGLFVAKHAMIFPEDRKAAGFLATRGGRLANFRILRSMIAFCRQRRIHLILITPPYYAGLMKMFRSAGLEPAYARWKQQLVSEVAHDGDRSITLWDFSGPSRYTLERPPQSAVDKRVMRWYWEYVHFKEALGDRILARILGDSTGNFGTVLYPSVTTSPANQPSDAAFRVHGSHTD